MSSETDGVGNVDPAVLETTGCPACGDTENLLMQDFDPFRVVRCRRCGCGYLSPRLTKKAAMTLYTAQYYKNVSGSGQGYLDYEKDSSLIESTAARRFKLIRPHLQSFDRALDVGCAMGYGLDALAGHFAELYGLDLVPEAIESINKRGYAGHCGEIFSCPWPEKSFDLITCFDSFEHIYEPGEFLRKIAELLRPGGIAAFATPDLDSLLRKLSARGWVSYKIPEHVAFYTRPAMTRLLEEAGLKVRFFARDVQRAGLRLILMRLGQALPVGRSICMAASRTRSASKISFAVPNGMFLVVAARENQDLNDE